jgi:hypothetical protein
VFQPQAEQAQQREQAEPQTDVRGFFYHEAAFI